MGASAFSFAGGTLIGAVEFGMSGFGAGFGSALGSGAGFEEALKSGGMGAAMGAATGAAIEGSYLAGWQNTLHGANRNEVGKASGVKRQVSLKVVKTPLAKIIQKIAGDQRITKHWGIRITDNYNEFNGTWDFDYIHTKFNDASVLSGIGAPGLAKLTTNITWSEANIMKNDLTSITKVYGNIQENLGGHWYALGSYTCQTWVENRLSLLEDNFKR